jgi:hypothetical protein
MINANAARVVMARMNRRLIVPVAFAAMTLPVAQAFAQGVFPAPLPGQSGASTSSPVPFFPPANAEAPSGCRKEFLPLREEAEERGRLIRAASERHAGPDEACKLIASFLQSEIKMIEYIEANSARCGITPEIVDRLKTGHQNTETMKIKVCKAAQETPSHDPSLSEILSGPKREPAGPVGDFGR